MMVTGPASLPARYRCFATPRGSHIVLEMTNRMMENGGSLITRFADPDPGSRVHFHNTLEPVQVKGTDGDFSDASWRPETCRLELGVWSALGSFVYCRWFFYLCYNKSST